MFGWIRELTPDQRVLDLGSGAGSLKSFEYACSVISVDCDDGAFTRAYQPDSSLQRVVALGESLPFASGVFDLVLCHHVLEHVEKLAGTLAEISRVLKPAGKLYVSVPNGYGLCDGVYRFVFEGGDHVNRFKRRELTALLEGSVGVRLTRWQKLYSSFAYLGRMRDLDPAILPNLPPRLQRFARLPVKVRTMLQSGLYVGTRFVDRVTGLDSSLYGWALYFERVSGGVAEEQSPYLNVCLYCGSGHPASVLERQYMVYQCPTCNRRGIYFPPFRNCS